MNIQIEIKGASLYAKPAVENINKLFSKLNEINNKGKKHIIILLDEVIINYNCIDFSGLQLDYPFITIIIAINPAGYNLTKEVVIKHPSRKNVLAVQLKTKHRNSYQIAVLISHINKFLNQEGGAYKCLDSANDKPLEPSNLPTGPLPIWIQRSPETSDEHVLDDLKSKISPEAMNVTLVHSGKRQFSYETNVWLQKANWNVCIFTDMTGSETEVLVAFIEDIFANMEVFSRARKRLIIVTK